MAINVPEIPSLFGALDSDAFSEDGGPFNSYALRALARNSNRLISKGQLLCSLAWPLKSNNSDVDSDIGTTFEGYSSPNWTRIHPPIPCPKKPGLTSATVKISVNIPSTSSILFQVVTRATRRDPLSIASVADPHVIEAYGDGLNATQVFTLDDVPIDSGGFEVIELWARSNGNNDLADASTTGGPVSGTHGSANVEILQDRIKCSTGTWNTSPPSFVSPNHHVYLYDGSGVLVAPPRPIWGVFSAAEFRFTPLDPAEFAHCVDTTGSFEVRGGESTYPYSISAFAVVANARVI